MLRAVLLLLLLLLLPREEGCREWAFKADESGAGVGVDEEEEELGFKLSCMFLIRLLIRDGGRGFFSGFTCGGSAAEDMLLPPPPPPPPPDEEGVS